MPESPQESHHLRRRWSKLEVLFLTSRRPSAPGAHRTILSGALLIVLFAGVARAEDPPEVLVARGTASVSGEGAANRWTIGNEAIRLSVAVSPQGALSVAGLTLPGSDAQWDLASAADVSFHTGTMRLVPGSGDFLFREARAEDVEGAVRLALVFESASARIRAIRTYACFPGAPAIEVWTSFEPFQTGSAVTLSNIGVWELTVAGTGVNWVTGLHAPSTEGGPFTRRRALLGAGLELGSTGRSTTYQIPVVWLDGPAGHLFAGLLWSGAWTMSITPSGPAGRSTIRASLGSIATTMGPRVTIETPHGFFGVAGAGEGDVARAIGDYMRIGVRHGRSFSALVTYNTWYAYGIRIDESTLLAQMGQAASLGAELFVVDAGWYTGGSSVSDYSTGTGRWTADPARFPSGLKALSDRAHDLGMRFGIWMEPERVDTSTVDRPGMVRESWLATTNGRYDPGVKTSSHAQVCLASPEARQWVVDQVSRVVADSGADYLKWDNNFWTNCDRSGHGHGAHDGNLSHHQGLYDILSQIRARFPDLAIENCAEGGNRIDPGMMQFTDAAWMDDVTSPSAHVRHNLEGLGAIYPPDYLLSFVKDDPEELIHGADDMALLFRSRMPGVLGLSLRAEEFGDDDTADMRSAIAGYKALRQTLSDATLIALTPQGGAPDSNGWDVIELLSVSSGNAVVYAFSNAEAPVGTVVRLQSLDPGATYTVAAPRGRVLATLTGAELLADGIGLARRSSSSASVLLITKQPSVQAIQR